MRSFPRWRCLFTVLLVCVLQLWTYDHPMVHAFSSRDPLAFTLICILSSSSRVNTIWDFTTSRCDQAETTTTWAGLLLHQERIHEESCHLHLNIVAQSSCLIQL